MAYRSYVTDSLKLNAEGKYLVDRYIDIIRPQKGSKQEKVKMTADEIALSIISRAGLKVGG